MSRQSGNHIITPHTTIDSRKLRGGLVVVGTTKESEVQSE